MTKIALIGGGYWGKNYINCIGEIENIQLSWVYNKHNEIEKQHLPPKTIFTKDYHEILKDDQTKAVIISTPPKTHYQIAKDALKARKDVLIEKPMTYCARESLELSELADKNSNILMVGHIFRYNLAMIELKNRIQKNELGELLCFHSRRVGMGPIRSDVSAMWNLAPHDISIINYLTGETPKTVSAKGACFVNKDVEDVVELVLEYENNVKAFVHVSWFEPKKVRETIVVGSENMVVFDDTLVEKLKIVDNSDIEKVCSLEFKNINSLKNQCIHFSECIETRQQPLTNGYDGYEIVKILECAQESLKIGKEVTIEL